MQNPETISILGAGPAGLTAAVYAARGNLDPICIEGLQPGGQLTLTSEVENFPGFPSGIQGPALMDAVRGQAARFGTRFMQGEVLNVDFSKRPFLVTLADQSQIKTETLIIATGASAKWLNLPSERKLMGKGVSACATCDGFFFKNLDVAVVGGGDSALEEATFLSRFAKKIFVIHRRDQFRASKIMQDKVKNNPKITFILNSLIEEILGEKEVVGIRVKNHVTQKVQDIALQGVFVAIGHDPNTKPFRNDLKCDEKGYIMTLSGSTCTSVPGVFAAGDVADHKYRQAITAAGSGCMAAMDAERFLENGG